MDSEIKVFADNLKEKIENEFPTSIIHRTYHQRQEFRYDQPREKWTDIGLVSEEGYTRYEYSDKEFTVAFNERLQELRCPICGDKIIVSYEGLTGVFIATDTILNDEVLRKTISLSKIAGIAIGIIILITAAFLVKFISSVFIWKFAIAVSMSFVAGLIAYLIANRIESNELRKYDYFFIEKREGIESETDIHLTSKIGLTNTVSRKGEDNSHFFSAGMPPPATSNLLPGTCFRDLFHHMRITSIKFILSKLLMIVFIGTTNYQ